MSSNKHVATLLFKIYIKSLKQFSNFNYKSLYPCKTLTNWIMSLWNLRTITANHYVTRYCLERRAHKRSVCSLDLWSSIYANNNLN